MLAPSSKDGNFGARDEVATKDHLHWNAGQGKRFRVTGTRAKESGRGIKTQGRKKRKRRSLIPGKKHEEAYFTHVLIQPSHTWPFLESETCESRPSGKAMWTLMRVKDALFWTTSA